MVSTVSANFLRRSLIAFFNVVIDKMGVDEALAAVVIPVLTKPLPIVVELVVGVVRVVVEVDVADKEVDNSAISSCHLVTDVCNSSISFSTLRTVPCKCRISLCGGECVEMMSGESMYVDRESVLEDGVCRW